MVIAESKVAFSSTHLSLESYHRSESLKAWVGDRRPAFEGDPPASTPARDRVELSGRLPEGTEAAAGTEPEEAGEEKNLEPKYRLLKEMIERWLHLKIKDVFDPRELSGGASAPEGNQAPQGVQSAGYGVEYDRTESRYEMETTSFAASGVIKTADGREISFDLSLNMTREYASLSSVSVRAGDAVRKDPLVVNYGGSAAELTSVGFSFDLDADGTGEQVAALSGNSAYLALDKNGDGAINDGSELFGATTGDGFAELASYDTDHNGWIDGNDGIFGALRSWRPGAGALQSLTDAGIGAIFLGSRSTPFELRSGDNAALGGVKSSGIFLRENGSVGTIQQIDLAV